MNKKKIKSAELISIISHEIKNSLNPIINLSGLMLKERERKLSGTEREYLEVIERSGRRILTLIDHMSYLNRLKSSGSKRVSVSVPLAGAIEDSVNAAASCKNSCRVRAVCIIDSSDVETAAAADPELFKRIIFCITEFFLSIRDIDYLYFIISSDNGHVSFYISERDPGESGKTGSMDGSSELDPAALSETALLWYSIAEELISVQGGDVTTRMADNGEVIFLFTLPLPSEAQSADSEEPFADREVTREFIMMVIDDDPDTIIPLRAIAEHEFHGLCRLVHAHTGSEGIDLLEKIRPDVILLDLTLPDISGITLVRSIRNFFVKDYVTVIAFTGHDMGLNREKLVSSGFDDVIMKPFDIDVFVEKIRNFIR